MGDNAMDTGVSTSLCTNCNEEVPDDGNSFGCIVCHKRTHGHTLCIKNMTKTSITQLKKIINKTSTTEEYSSSFYHICEKCIAFSKNKGGLVAAILGNDKIVHEERKKYRELVEAIKKEAEEMKRNHSALTLSNNALRKQKSLDDKELNKLRMAETSRIATLQQTLKLEKAIVTAQKTEIEKSNKRLNEAQIEIAELKKKVTEANERIEKLQDPNRAPKRKKSTDGNPLEVGYNDIVTITSRIAESQRQTAELMEEIKKINTKLDTIAITPNGSQSTAKKGEATAETKKAAVPRIEKTYARIMIDSEDNSKKIRHINGKGDDAKSRAENLAKFMEDEKVKDVKFAQKRSRGDTSITVVMESTDDADALDALITADFANIVEIKKVILRRPMVKIVRIPTTTTDKEEIKAEILTRNDWLTTGNFEVDQVFTIKIGETEYCNCILSCDIETQEKIVQHSNIAYGESMCKAYEQLELLQCTKCSRFGHISINCTNATSCKKCSGDHQHTLCTSTELKCTNCEIANKSFGKTYNTSHNAAFDRCPVRLERVEAIKGLILAKN